MAHNKEKLHKTQQLILNIRKRKQRN